MDNDWIRSEQYHNASLIPTDPILNNVIAHCRANNLPDIAVTAAQGKFLMLIAKSICAKRILEVGTLGAYSTIWMARALPDDGELVTAELSPQHAQVALENLTTASLAHKVKIITGPAATTLQSLPDDPKFDLAFIDADKPSNAMYFTLAKRLVRSGGVIIIDNVVRSGNVSKPSCSDADALGVRDLLEILKDDPEIDATTISTVGEKGWDGFMYAIRK